LDETIKLLLWITFHDNRPLIETFDEYYDRIVTLYFSHLKQNEKLQSKDEDAHTHNHI
jgi:hypothetical protein